MLSALGDHSLHIVHSATDFFGVCALLAGEREIQPKIYIKKPQSRLKFIFFIQVA